MDPKDDQIGLNQREDQTVEPISQRMGQRVVQKDDRKDQGLNRDQRGQIVG